MATIANPNNSNISGARCTFTLNGQVVAWARSVSWSSSYAYEEVRTLNSLRVVTFTPTSYRTSVSFSQFRVPKQTLSTLGFFPQTGATNGDQLTNVLTLPDLNAVVVDQVSGSAIATIVGVKIAGASYSLDAGGGVLAQEVDCVAIACYMEDETNVAA